MLRLSRFWPVCLGVCSFCLIVVVAPATDAAAAAFVVAFVAVVVFAVLVVVGCLMLFVVALPWHCCAIAVLWLLWDAVSRGSKN